MTSQTVFQLNPLKKGPDNNYHKIEIPVSLASQPAASSDAEFCSKRVNKNQYNSNCQIDFNYANGLVQVIACLIGPSESRFQSKQDYTKAFIEINLKVTPGCSDKKQELACNLRQCLDQIIQGTMYPKQLFTFQVTVVSDYSKGTQVFPAIVNACICLINQAGIAQKEAPFAGLSLSVDNEDQERVELVANPKGDILWLKMIGPVDGSVIFDTEFEKKVRNVAKKIINVTFN